MEFPVAQILRLVDQTRVNWQNRAHFFGVAAQMMRRILVDHARARTGPGSAAQIFRNSLWTRILTRPWSAAPS
ncbi:MAG TPA: ECF-type sigma factor [Pyrinomonadaceae bacterium]|jgi:carbon monoxide dehydrogenase subunit G